jgi:hemerythrin-like domain-containing protein
MLPHLAQMRGPGLDLNQGGHWHPATKWQAYRNLSTGNAPVTKPHPLRENRLSRLQRNPLDLLEHDHARQAGLCDMLEQIADSLPADIDRRRCREAASALRHDLPLHHLDEEQGLFPLLRRHAAQSENLAAIMARLSSEHTADESFAEELTEELERLGEGGCPPNPEALGYMLRGFFESYRRHIHWETEILLPLARETLTETDLDELFRCMANHRQA